MPNGRVYYTDAHTAPDWVNRLTVAPGSPVTAKRDGGGQGGPAVYAITLFVVAADGEILFTRATNFLG
jgi:hypothetical protein